MIHKLAKWDWNRVETFNAVPSKRITGPNSHVTH